MATCTFCGQGFVYSGKMFIRSTGKVLFFCGSKCEKNMLKLGRKPVKQAWVRKLKKNKK